MKFGISNLSWKCEDDLHIKNNLIGYDYVETIFSRLSYGYYSVQSIFYNSEVKTFEDFESTLKRMNFVIESCRVCEIKIIVFGSPLLRKGSKKKLLKVFEKINPKLKEYKIFLCVEPNSSYYGGDYYFTIEEILNDIYEFSNIKTMIDSHNLILENKNLLDQYDKYSSYIKHCHFSEKDLLPIKNYSLYYDFVDFLKLKEYNFGITYELKYVPNIIQESKNFIKLKKMTKA